MSTRFAHIRPSGLNARDGGYTIAFMHAPEHGYVSYAIARCNPKDNFNKAVGRAIAEHRLDNGRGNVIKTRATKFKTIVTKLVERANAEIAFERKQCEVKRKKG